MLFKIMMEENERLRRETYFLRTDLFNSQEATITVSNSYTKIISVRAYGYHANIVLIRIMFFHTFSFLM